MRISQLTAFIVKLPLKREFKTAAIARRESENLIVQCLLEDQTAGWGEGVPRPYVTGETAQTAMARLDSTPLRDQLAGDCVDWQDVIQLCERFEPPVDREDPRGCGNNALRCAVELAILDAYGRLMGQPLSKVTERFVPANNVVADNHQFHYSAAIGIEGPRRESMSALKMRLYGFRFCKIKVGGTGDNDVLRLRRIRRWLGRRMDIRLDANEAWSANEAVSQIESLSPFQISCVEQPIAHSDLPAMAEIRKAVSVPLMLDESLTSMVDAERVIELQACDLFNIRLSKCGGFLNSLRLAARAKQAGLGYKLGCHPGESGILSAAGRHFAASVRDLKYLEGSFDRFLFKQPLTRPDVTFGYGGQAAPLTAPGLGITVESDLLKRWTIDQNSWSLT